MKGTFSRLYVSRSSGIRRVANRRICRETEYCTYVIKAGEPFWHLPFFVAEDCFILG
jgi:hypothetical protein